MLRVLTHIAGVACFGISLLAHLALGFITLPEHVTSSKLFQTMVLSYPGIWKFLTIWDVVIQLVYHSVALLNDVYDPTKTTPSNRQPTTLQKIRDELFAVLAFPVGLMVSTAFWGLYGIDRSLVFPKEVDAFYPHWLNHAVHTAPIALIISDLLTTPKVHPGRPSLPFNIGFTLIYISWITYVYSQVGAWPYPMLNLMNNFAVGILFAFSVAGGAGLYILGQKLTRLRWGTVGGSNITPRKRKGKKK